MSRAYRNIRLVRCRRRCPNGVDFPAVSAQSRGSTRRRSRHNFGKPVGYGRIYPATTALRVAVLHWNVFHSDTFSRARRGSAVADPVFVLLVDQLPRLMGIGTRHINNFLLWRTYPARHRYASLFALESGSS